LVRDVRPRVCAAPQFRRHDQSSLQFCCRKFAPRAYWAERDARSTHAKLQLAQHNTDETTKKHQIEQNALLLFVTPPRSSVRSISDSFTSSHRGTNSRITGLHFRSVRSITSDHSHAARSVCTYNTVCGDACDGTIGILVTFTWAVIFCFVCFVRDCDRGEN
jgi:hypothetical protein